MKKNLLMICTMLFTLNLAATGQVVVPVNGVMPTLTSVTINNGAGDQYDPHVSGDLAAYTSDLSIRYYNFATDSDAAIPMGISALKTAARPSQFRVTAPPPATTTSTTTSRRPSGWSKGKDARSTASVAR